VIDESVVRENLQRIRERIASAGGTNVKVVAVTKSLPASAWTVASAVGCDAIGENYAQEITSKSIAVANHVPVHFIGQLQSNKVRHLTGLVDVWQTVDRESLLREIVKRAEGLDSPRIFVQVNTTNELNKGGCEPREARRLVELARSLGCRVDGAMTVGPTSADVKETREAFAVLRDVADDLGLVERSMGMTGDLEIAVEEGSTMVRIGTALFGQRP
jgi:pyridoxal phosphate enzyme (YggS family)